MPLPQYKSFRNSPLFASLEFSCGTHLILDVVVNGRYVVVFVRPGVKQTKTLHCHGMNRVRDRLVEISRQIVRDVELAAPRFSCG